MNRKVSFGDHRIRLFSFTLVGIACTSLQLLLLYLGVQMGASSLWSNVFGFLASTQINFVLNYHTTWSGLGRVESTIWHLFKGLGQFNLLSIGILVCNSGFYWIAQPHMHYLLAGLVSLVGTVAGMIVKYLLSHYLIMATKTGKPETKEAFSEI